MYLESVKNELNSIDRKGVMSKFVIQDDALEADNVELQLDEEEKRIVVVPCEEDEKHVCLLDKVGMYKGHTAIADILFINENTMVLMPVKGFVCISTVDEEMEEVVSCLDVSDEMPKLIRLSDIIWKSAKDIIETIRSAKGQGSWGVRSHKNTFDYIYRVSMTNKTVDKEVGYSLKCLGTFDISLGLIEKESAKDTVREYKYERLKYEREHSFWRSTKADVEQSPVVDSEDEEDYLDMFED